MRLIIPPLFLSLSRSLSLPPSLSSALNHGLPRLRVTRCAMTRYADASSVATPTVNRQLREPAGRRGWRRVLRLVFSARRRCLERKHRSVLSGPPPPSRGKKEPGRKESRKKKGEDGKKRARPGGGWSGEGGRWRRKERHRVEGRARGEGSAASQRKMDFRRVPAGLNSRKMSKRAEE